VIAIVDYGRGNLGSVEKAFVRLGMPAVVTQDARVVDDARAVVLPGDGAFHDAMDNLGRLGLLPAVRRALDGSRPFLGICLGYQLLFESSEETPGIAGLGALPGIVKKFPAGALKVPHMGWNTLAIRQPEDRLYAGLPGVSPSRDLPTDPSVYFVHSFFPVPEEEGVITSTADYGETFAASVGRGRVAAVQFHPEKSQKTGLAMIRNFLATL